MRARDCAPNKVALLVQVDMKTDLREICGAPTRAAAEAVIDVFADKIRSELAHCSRKLSLAGIRS
jgi:hypothetical protein